MTGKLEDQELEAVAGGIQTITVSDPIPDSVRKLWAQENSVDRKLLRSPKKVAYDTACRKLKKSRLLLSLDKINL